jgi:V/A-type H+-transporting ATPase subunit F
LRKFIVLTDPESADGFRLAGVEVLEASIEDRTDTKRKLIGLINDDDVGIIGIDEDLLLEIDEPTRLKIDRLYRPIVIAIPAKKKLGVSEARHSFLASMIHRAIGFDIRVGRNA